jgi:peptidoglycan/LPS O-acetylase OafA/YrhL
MDGLMNKVYFPNLNGLRFIAALLVIIQHVEQIKSLTGLDNYYTLPFISVIGKLGVILFFVLSGFLITYLLLTEDQKTNTISVKKFYIRRILRIWPLYYLVVVLSFFILPNFSFFNINSLSSDVTDNFGFKFILFVIFLPNLALMLYTPVPFISQAWSVGVEEQFYLIWPVLIKKVKKNIEYLLFGIIGGYIIIVVFGFRFIHKYLFWNHYLDVLSNFLNSFNIDCMAIGGLFALYLFRRNSILTFLFKKYVQLLVIILTCILIGLGVKIPYIHYEVYAILFGFIILNLAANPNPVISLDNKLFNYLGKISYGLYMYQPIAILLTIKVLNIIGLNIIYLQHLSSLLITIIISGLSYWIYESYFIKKKINYSKILSGDNVR